MNARQRRKRARTLARIAAEIQANMVSSFNVLETIGSCVMPVLISGREGPRWWQKKKKPLGHDT